MLLFYTESHFQFCARIWQMCNHRQVGNFIFCLYYYTQQLQLLLLILLLLQLFTQWMHMRNSKWVVMSNVCMEKRGNTIFHYWSSAYIISYCYCHYSYIRICNIYKYTYFSPSSGNRTSIYDCNNIIIFKWKIITTIIIIWNIKMIFYFLMSSQSNRKKIWITRPSTNTYYYECSFLYIFRLILYYIHIRAWNNGWSQLEQG